MVIIWVNITDYFYLLKFLKISVTDKNKNYVGNPKESTKKILV